ncbi:Ldh family oxidoreductase [Umezawaea endophytica]|uniref:Ldh family oxidoreductase n=1 Tax=Umezawaea endophytica TaxID=1654476 RepID=A0A9X3A0C2_9PSEU|nr:Ldh family oxidoreductase [Umezawaea endophytica]MCS7476818.1 Ldh family oxidoreductase [Umezawaea endophytica]
MAPIHPPQAARTVREALTARGVPDHDAAAVADVLVDTTLLGVETHGLRLLGTYLDELDHGVANARPEFSITKDRGAAVLLDANDALGVVAALHAVDLAVDRARLHGVAAVGVVRSNHFGAAGAYTRRIAARGMLGVATTSAASRVAPFGGADPLFGTNPVSVAFGDEFCLDMATSQVCYSEVKERARTGRPLSAGWAVDSTGAPVADPAEAHALSPLGGYKGQGLAMAVTLLTSVLLGAPLDWELAHVNAGSDGRGRRVSHQFLAFDPNAFGGGEAARRNCAALLATVRGSTPADPDQPVLTPGDPQRAHRARQEVSGLDLDDATRALLEELA